MAWLTGYSRRKKVTLTGGVSGAQTDFQLSIAVAYAAAMQGDFDDIRFTQADGTTLIDAWAEVIVTDTSATVLVEFPTTPANTVEQDYYMYYGNGAAASYWDGDATFNDFIDNEGYNWIKDGSNPIVDVGGVGAWDEKMVYSMALPANISDGSIIKQGTGNDEFWLFYTGAGDTTTPNHETSVGLAKSTDFRSPVKYGSNPVINRSAVGLGSAGQGISVFDIKYIGTKYYIFLMANYGSPDFRIAMMESTDLLTWTNFTVVLSGNYKDHCPYVIEDPDDSSKLIMYYAYQPSSGDQYYRIGRATAAKSTPYTWTYDTTNNPILYVASSHRLYPNVEYNAGTYDMYFGKYPSSGYFAVYKTSNTVDTSFSDSSNQIINYGSGGAWDDGYASAPRKYSDGGDDWIYYTGRKYGANVYTGVGIVEWLSGGSLSEWDVTGGGVSATTDHPFKGSYGIKFPTTGASPYPAVQNDCIGKNRIYETWIYDDMITTANFQNMARLYDTSGADPAVGIWIGTSTTHYVYRPEGGSWTASSVARSSGWHKLTFVVASFDTKIYIDDALIFTETGLDEDNLNYFYINGYTGGTGYSDTYLVRKYASGPPTYAFGSEESESIVKSTTSDLLLKKLFVESTTSDLLLKKLGIIKSTTSDLLLKKLFVESTTSDLLLKKLGIIKSATSDLLLKKLGIIKSATSDLILIGLNIKLVTSDLLLKKLNIIKTITSDLLLKKLVIKTITSDLLLKKLFVESTTSDLMLKKFGIIKTITSNLLLKKLNIIKSATSDLILTELNAKLVTSDLLLKKLNIIKLTTSNLLLKKLFTKSVTSNLLLKKLGIIISTTSDLILTTVGLVTRIKSITFDLILNKRTTSQITCDIILAGLPGRGTITYSHINNGTITIT